MVSGVVAGCDKLGRVIIKAFIHDKPFVFMQFPFTQNFGGTQSVSRWQSKINI